MLEKVQQLGDSVTRDQLKDLEKTLGEKLFSLLDHALDSEDEEEAESRVAAFVAEAKKSPIKVLKVRKILTPEQKDIVMELMGD